MNYIHRHSDTAACSLYISHPCNSQLGFGAMVEIGIYQMNGGEAKGDNVEGVFSIHGFGQYRIHLQDKPRALGWCCTAAWSIEVTASWSITGARLSTTFVGHLPST